jgi:hypothetical protein
MRGALLIIVAVLLGAGLLANGFRDSGTSTTSGATPTTKRSTTTLPGGATPSTVAQPHDPAQVKVLALNGSGKSGIAKAAADLLKAANYTTLDPSNAKGATVATSIVYYLAGYEADAATIAVKLGLPASAAQPLPTPVPASVADPKDANVVVVVGTDAPVAAGAGTTSPTPTSGTGATPTSGAGGTTTTSAN